MKIWGIHKRHKALSWFENFMGGHISIGHITIYGANAMRWAVNIKTKRWGYICFTLPFPMARIRTKSNGEKYWDWYFYLSPNGTPWACTMYYGSDRYEHIRAKIRKFNFGHGFSTDEHMEALMELNNRFSRLSIIIP